MTITTFILNNSWVDSTPVPIDINDLRSNLLRRQRVFFCLHCGEIFARIVSDSPLFPGCDVNFHPCPDHGGSFVFFNNWELSPLLDVLPKPVLSLELLARTRSEVDTVRGVG
jgi:hypothetical protein